MDYRYPEPRKPNLLGGAPNIHPVMFAMWDKKDYSEIIWNLIRPEFKKL